MSESGNDPTPEPDKKAGDLPGADLPSPTPDRTEAAKKTDESKPSELTIPLPEDIPPEVVQALQSGAGRLTVSQHSSYIGPLPPPEYLEQLSNVIPDGGARLFDNFEAESRHRRATEWVGMSMGFIIALAGIATAGIVAWLGQPWVGGAIVVSAMAAIGSANVIRLFRRK